MTVEAKERESQLASWASAFLPERSPLAFYMEADASAAPLAVDAEADALAGASADAMLPAVPLAVAASADTHADTDAPANAEAHASDEALLNPLPVIRMRRSFQRSKRNLLEKVNSDSDKMNESLFMGTTFFRCQKGEGEKRAR